MRLLLRLPISGVVETRRLKRQSADFAADALWNATNSGACLCLAEAQSAVAEGLGAAPAAERPDVVAALAFPELPDVLEAVELLVVGVVGPLRAAVVEPSRAAAVGLADVAAVLDVPELLDVLEVVAPVGVAVAARPRAGVEEWLRVAAVGPPASVVVA